jgi:hypothetical protein
MIDGDMYYVPSTDCVGWSGEGSVTITIPMGLLKKAYRRIRSGIGEAESVEGFFDFAKKAINAVGKAVSSIAKSPLVKVVAGYIPYGSTAMQVLTAADDALTKARKAIATKPATHKAIRRAATGDSAAKRALQNLPPVAREAAKRAIVLQKESLTLAKGLTMAKKALVDAGYTPGLQRALMIQRAPWA